MKRLLPYEIQLAKELGLSDEEYLVFKDYQMKYSQKHPASEAGEVVAPMVIIPIIIGIVLSILAYLLTPKPDLGKKNDAKTEKFASGFGFNSTVNLTSQGSVIPLIFTDKTINVNGGIRAKLALVWSEVLSFGLSQFGRFLGVVGSGELEEIDPISVAIGNTLLNQGFTNRSWLYIREGGLFDERPRASDVVNTTLPDPSIPAGQPDLIVYQGRRGNTRLDTYSQALQPSADNEVGVIGFLAIGPLEVRVTTSSNQVESCNLNTTAVRLPGNTSVWGGNYVIGDKINYIIPAAPPVAPGNGEAIDRAQQIKINLLTEIDTSSIYQLGTSLFVIESVGGDISDQSKFELDVNGAVPDPNYSVVVTFRCSQPGVGALDEGGLSDQLRREATRGILKIAQLKYKSLRKVHFLDLSLRTQVWQLVSGEDNSADNGYHNRQLGLTLFITLNNGTRYRYPVTFVVRDRRQADAFRYLKLSVGVNAAAVDWRIEALPDPYLVTPPFGYLETVQTPTSTEQVYFDAVSGITASWVGKYFTTVAAAPVNKEAPRVLERALYDRRERTRLSFDGGRPELSLAIATEHEIVGQAVPPRFSQLAMVGLNVYSTQGLQSLQQLSVFVNRGIKVKYISDDPVEQWVTRSSSYFPDLFYYLLTDTSNGVGNYIPIEAIDIDSLRVAKKFCIANNLFCDIQLTDRVNINEWFTGLAPKSLLEFARIDGRFSLIPALPYDPISYEIDFEAIRPVTLFTEGNILADSFKETILPFEEVSPVQIVVTWRDQEVGSSFAVEAAATIRLDLPNSETFPTQSLDLTDSVTNRSQALLIGKYALMARYKNVRQVTFSIIPDQASGLRPGDYFYLLTSTTSFNQFYTGKVLNDGSLVCQLPVPDGDYRVLLYRSDFGQPLNLNMFVSENKLSPIYADCIVAIGQESTEKRIFRSEKTEIDAEGLCSITASLYTVLDLSDNNFIIEE